MSEKFSKGTRETSRGCTEERSSKGTFGANGEPYAGKLHVRFDEGYPQSRRRVAKRCTSRGAGVPHGASRSTLHPRIPRERSLVADAAA